MDEQHINKIFNERINILIEHLVNNHPKSYSTNIINNMIHNLSIDNIIIRFSLKIWQLTPNQLFNLEDIIDISILTQMSYETYLLFIDTPDMCNYYNPIISSIKTPAQIQLSIIWLTAYIMSRTSELLLDWQNKVMESDKTFMFELGEYFQEKIIDKHKQLSLFPELDNDLIIRRNKIIELIKEHDKEFYKEIIYFYFSLLVTRQITTTKYQKELLDEVDISYYDDIYQKITKKRKRSKVMKQSQLKISDMMYNIYNKMHKQYNNSKNIGIQFL